MYELFKIGFLSFQLTDLVDIAIVAAIVFGTYKALKGTVVIQILIGLVIIIALSFITESAQLKSLSWLLKTIRDIWLLVFVILFQPELRRLLLLITRSPIFKLFVKSKISETIDEVLEAAIEMSEKHIGALIVFTRSQKVQMTVDSGVPIRSQVSSELLLSIFNVKSPLHDGAVIIDNDVIMAARCVLPISSITKIGNRNLGTRHRAALGLTEQVDAVVLIVSEETGDVSIAEGGKLNIGVKKEDLPTVLGAKLSAA